ncbi:MAG TPA: hypothetical protein VJW75_04975 [Candidatus Eisenbacteria bacterium]|nr:hypothetical protein [Candidatus Eisenbacteria bacterium]
MTRGHWIAALLVALLVAVAPAAGVHAQEATPPDTTAAEEAATPDSTVTSPGTIDLSPLEPPESTRAPEPPDEERLDRDRFEWGAGVVEGYFDWVGTFAYRRFLRDGGPFQQNVMIEVAGAKKDYLGEGAVSILYLFRPLKTVRPAWRVRPLLEFGGGGHLVIQVADIAGFDDTGFHTKVYGKMHAFAGLEALLTRRWGVLVRGRFTMPSERPLDYAQAAIFLR